MTTVKNISLIGTAVAVFAVLPASAAAQESAGLRISLNIPEVCQIETSTITVDESGRAASGSVFEMCNSGRGFRVMASHRTLSSGEEVEISYAGKTSQLDSSGLSDVAYRSGPTVGQVPVLIQSTGLLQNLTISLGMAII